jgi:hypothetical protein
MPKKDKVLPAHLRNIRERSERTFRKICRKGGLASAAKRAEERELIKELKKLREKETEEEILQMQVSANEHIVPIDPDDAGEHHH